MTRWCGGSDAPAIDSAGRLTLTIAGEGPERESLERLAASLDVPTTFAGWVDDRAKADLLSRAVVLAIPSLWPEPFGLVGLEAAAFGVPAVGFDVGGISTWLTNDVNGRLVSAAAGADGLGDAIAAILRDAEYPRAVVVWRPRRRKSLYRGRTSRVARARAAVGSTFMTSVDDEVGSRFVGTLNLEPSPEHEPRTTHDQKDVK